MTIWLLLLREISDDFHNEESQTDVHSVMFTGSWKKATYFQVYDRLLNFQYNECRWKHYWNPQCIPYVSTRRISTCLHILCMIAWEIICSERYYLYHTQWVDCYFQHHFSINVGYSITGNQLTEPYIFPHIYTKFSKNELLAFLENISPWILLHMYHQHERAPPTFH